ncbi:hypothetical protein GALL_51890 [mine drainage metagenome]|uniref:Uncharacterized protein n=1 Tax=mine drainage metagenome TaxID=410659 RepID=A0A1J5SXW7_9ZZZZ
MSHLDELKRQRALIAQHLDWLDRQIAAEAGSFEEPPPTAAPAPEAENDLLAVPASFVAESHQRVGDARRGCMVAFGLFLLLLGIATVIVYFVGYRR